MGKKKELILKSLLYYIVLTVLIADVLLLGYQFLSFARYELKEKGIIGSGREFMKDYFYGPEKVSSRRNAATYYESALDSLKSRNYREVYMDIIGNREAMAERNNENLKALIQKYHRVFTPLKKAARLEKCRFRKAPGRWEAEALSRLLIAEALIFERQKKYQSALEDYLSVFKFSQDLERNGRSMCLRIGLSVEELFLKNFGRFLSGVNDNYELLAKASSALAKADARAARLWDAFEADRKIHRGASEFLIANRNKKLLEFQTNPPPGEDAAQAIANLKEDINIQTRILEATRKFYEKAESELQKSYRDFTQGPLGSPQTSVQSDDPVPARIAELSKSLLDLCGRYHMARAKVRGLLLICAVRQYELRNKEVPETLEILKSDYLSSVPEDPFSGKPFILKKTPDGVLVYSVGPDATDDGGTREYSQKESAGDIIFYLQNQNLKQ